MHSISSLTFLLFLTVVTAASPYPALSFVKTAVGQRPSQPRKKAEVHRRGSPSLDLSNSYGVQYNVRLQLGTPPQNLSVQLDTGSSNFWVPATRASVCDKDGCYLGAFDANRSTTYRYVSSGFEIDYYDPGDSDIGDFVTDNLDLGSGVALENVSFGLAYDAVDPVGVLGLSFTFEEEGEYVPTVLDLMKNQGLISRAAYSIYLDSVNSSTGTVLFGAVDPSKYIDPLISLPMQPDYTANITDLSVTLTNVTFLDAAGQTHAMATSDFPPTPAVLDTGTWDLELPTPIANAIIEGVGAVQTEDEGWVVPCSYAHPHASTPPVFKFQFAGPSGPTISVPLSELLTDASFAFADGERACSLGIDPVDNDLGGFLLFGDSFIRNAYLVYDLENLEIAMAQARFHDAKDATATKNTIQAIPAGTAPVPGVTRIATQVQVNTSAFTTNTYFDGNTQQMDTSTFTSTASSTQQVDSTLVPASTTLDLGSSTRNAGAVYGMKGNPVLGLGWLGSVWVGFAGAIGMAAILF